jgi:hypothetical protein
VKPSEGRYLLGPAALLSVERAASCMPLRDADARRLLEEAGVIRRLAGRRVVLWAEAIALAVPEQERRADRPAPSVRLKKAKL